jgi:hypothetical protein
MWSVGGHFKGKEPTVLLERLQDAWLDSSSLVYIGQTGSLRKRLDLLARFSRGEAVGHWGAATSGNSRTTTSSS